MITEVNIKTACSGVAVKSTNANGVEEMHYGRVQGIYQHELCGARLDVLQVRWLTVVRDVFNHQTVEVKEDPEHPWNKDPKRVLVKLQNVQEYNVVYWRKAKLRSRYIVISRAMKRMHGDLC